jgi:hypothetical protein
MYPGFGKPEPENLQPEIEQDDRRLTVEEEVYAWRLLSLMDAGAGLDHAELLALSKADLHRVCDALRAGCSPLRAVAIFT